MKDRLGQMLSYTERIQIRIGGGHYTLDNWGGTWAVYEGWNIAEKSFLKKFDDLETAYIWVYDNVPKWTASGPRRRNGKEIE